MYSQYQRAYMELQVSISNKSKYNMFNCKWNVSKARKAAGKEPSFISLGCTTTKEAVPIKRRNDLKCFSFFSFYFITFVLKRRL